MLIQYLNEILNHLSCGFFSPFVAIELSSCANVLELTRTKQGPFTLEEHALPEDRWTIDDIAQSLEQCSSLLPAEMALKKSKPEESAELL